VTPQTIAGAGEYWDHYYGSEFVFGLGTEHILAGLLPARAQDLIRSPA